MNESKTTVLIYCHWSNFGGAERALINLFKVMPKENFDITLMLYNKSFSFAEDIPSYVKIVNPYYKKGMDASFGIRRLVQEKLKQKKYFMSVSLFVGELFYKLFGRDFLLKELLFEKQNIKYDYMFNWSGVSKIGDIISNNLYEFKKKYIWIHDAGILENKKYRNFLKKYDYIFCVSKELTDKVKVLYEDIADKIVTLYNPVDTDTILKLSNSIGFKDNYNGCRILSVGRLAYVKGFDIAIKTCKILIDKGYNCKWYLIGDGKERNSLPSIIKENKLENNFVLLGRKENPYPFFKDCDIYVQPSRSEGYCLTLTEAKIFNKPIVTTVFPGTYEQIKDNETGIIVETTPEGIAAGVQKLLDNKDLREKLINNLKEENKLPKQDYFAELKKYL